MESHGDKLRWTVGVQSTQRSPQRSEFESCGWLSLGNQNLFIRKERLDVVITFLGAWCAAMNIYKCLSHPPIYI